MRLFNIIKQDKEWILDLDGNAYHPRLRKDISVGMIVGLQVSQRDLKKAESLEFLKQFADDDFVIQEHKIYREDEKKENKELMEKIKIIKTREKKRSEDLMDDKSLLDENMKSLCTKIKEENNNSMKNELIKEKKRIEFEIKKLKKNIERLDKQIKDIEYAIKENSSYYAISLLYEYRIPNDLRLPTKIDFECGGALEKFMEIEERIKNSGWKETIFFKIVKRTRSKMYGEVIARFRKSDSKYLLKEGDRISFYDSDVLFVPSVLNNKSKLKSYYITNYTHEYFSTNRVTNWNGIFLDKSARDFLTPGSIARIQIKTRGLRDTWYVEILEKDGDLFYGELLDYYKFEEDYGYDNPTKIGCIFGFKKESIIEIPIIWNPNIKKELEKCENSANYGYFITGMQCGEKYYTL